MIKIKYSVMLALIFCMGAFLFPMTVQAVGVDPPTVRASVSGEILRIETQNGFYAVEAIFVNGRRFNFRVDSVLQVDLLAFDDSETLIVYAIDFAGNRSNIVTVINPHYTPIVAQPPQGIPITPPQPPQTNPFTPDGQASVLDNATDGDEKEFFTFQTPAGNVFFLIVDRQRESNNVYFLNAVTEQDLLALAAQAGNEISVSGSGDGGIPIPPTTIPITPEEPTTDTTADTEPETSNTPPAESGGSNNGTMIFLLIAIAIAGGVGYYLKIVRPKQQAQDDDYADEDEEDLGEEMEFEEEPAEQDDSDENSEDYYNTADSDDSEDGETRTEDDK